MHLPLILGLPILEIGGLGWLYMGYCACGIACPIRTTQYSIRLPDPIQSSPVLRSIVLMTESILPLNTCLATLRVKPLIA